MNVALLGRVWELAEDVGRLRRRVDPETSLSHLADRIADHVEALHLLTTPSAGELVAWTAPGDEEAVVEALEIVDERWRLLRSRLGGSA